MTQRICARTGQLCAQTACEYPRCDPVPSWNVGWRCPSCGAGNAPSTPRCACVPTLVYSGDPMIVKF